MLGRNPVQRWDVRAVARPATGMTMDDKTDGQLLIELKRHLAAVEAIKAELIQRARETDE